MQGFCPRRLLPLLRVLVLVLFALGLVLQPVLAAAGEMHELAHDPSGAHSHAPHGNDPDAESSAADTQGDGAENLHVLLDFAHCCGATAATLYDLKPVPVAPTTDRLAIAKARVLPQARLPAPFKPPIFV